MKQKIVFITLLAFVVSIKANAYKIHWITFVDTTTPGVTARVDPNTRDILYDRWIRVISAALAPAGYESCKYDYYGSRTSPGNCEEVIRNLKLQSNEDIIVFYYIGHGARSPYDKSKFPQMCLATDNDKDWIPLERVHNQLKAQNARLTITIGMCCNSFYDTNSKSYSFRKNYESAAYITNSQLATISKLFLGSKGDLIASSSTIGEGSSAIVDLRGNLAQTDLGETDYYTYTLIKGIEFIPENQDISLATYFDVVGKEVSRRNPKQHPQFISNLTNAVPPIKPVAEEHEVDETKSLEELLLSGIDYLIDKDVKLNKKIAFAEDFSKHFTSSAIAITLSQDKENPVNHRKVEDFFWRIATSRILIDVQLYDFDVDKNGKIKELRVKEFYRKNK